MANLVFCDIDGVVANNDHRLSLMHDKKWDEFYSDEEIAKDEPIWDGICFVKRLARNDDDTLVFVTGRRESCRKATINWLYKYRLKHFTAICMRPEKDFRKSPELKVEMIEAFLKNCHDRCERYDHIYFIDDYANNVVEVSRRYLIPEDVTINNQIRISGITYGIGRLSEDDEQAE